jgi:hypothetical protein
MIFRLTIALLLLKVCLATSMFSEKSLKDAASDKKQGREYLFQSNFD